jgi:hypothetical protein
VEATCGVNGGAVGCVYSLTVCGGNDVVVMWDGRDAARMVSGEAVDGVDGVVVRGGDD